MNEKEYYRCMIRKFAVDDRTVERTACAPVESGGSTWKRAAAIAAVSAAALIGTVLAIPGARAEVARWFGIRSPEQYLMTEPEEREPSEALDALIVPPDNAAQSGTDATAGSRVRYCADEPVWQAIAHDFSIDLGETMYDGERLYLSVTLHGLSALPDVDGYTGGSATMTKLSDDVEAYLENGGFPNGVDSLYESSMGQYYLRFSEIGDALWGAVSAFETDPGFRAALDRIYQTYGEGRLSDADRAAISSDSIRWLSGSALNGVVRFNVAGTIVSERNGEPVPIRFADFLKELADENGILTAQVIYRAYGQRDGEQTVLLEADLGTARFNIGAIERLDRIALNAGTPTVTFGRQDVLLSKTKRNTTGGTSVFSVTNLPADLNGTVMTVENGACLDGIGVHDLHISFTLPDSWTDEMIDVFSRMMTFRLEIDGERCFISASHETSGERTVRYTIETTEFPYQRFADIRTVRVIPELHCLTALILQDGSRTELRPNVCVCEPGTGEAVSWEIDSVEPENGTVVFTAIR